MLGHDVAVTSAEESRGQRLGIRHQNKAETAWFEQGPRLREKLAWLCQVFQNRPKGNGVEALLSEVVIEEGCAQDVYVPALGVIQSWPCDIGAESRVSTGMTDR